MAGDDLGSQQRDTRLDDRLPVLIDDGAGDGAVPPRAQCDVASPLAFGKFERLRRPAGTAHAIPADQDSGSRPIENAYFPAGSSLKTNRPFASVIALRGGGRRWLKAGWRGRRRGGRNCQSDDDTGHRPIVRAVEDLSEDQRRAGLCGRRLGIRRQRATRGGSPRRAVAAIPAIRIMESGDYSGTFLETWHHEERSNEEATAYSQRLPRAVAGVRTLSRRGHYGHCRRLHRARARGRSRQSHVR